MASWELPQLLALRRFLAPLASHQLVQRQVQLLLLVRRAKLAP